VLKLQTPVNLRAFRGIEFFSPVSPETLPPSVASVTSVAGIYYLTAEISKKRKENVHNITQSSPGSSSARGRNKIHFATRCTKATKGRQVMKMAIGVCPHPCRSSNQGYPGMGKGILINGD